MNWKLIFLLSLFGLAMGLLTISVIPSSVEPICWLIIFLISAISIAKNCQGNFFLHGFMTAIFNCVWITAMQLIMYHSYVLHHPQVEASFAKTPLATHPRLAMCIMDIIIGIVSGLVMGLFAFIASKTPLRAKVAA